MALNRAVVELLTERSGSVETEAPAAEPRVQTEAPATQETSASPEATAKTDAAETETAPESAGKEEQPEQAEVVDPDAAETEAQPKTTEPGTSEAGASEEDAGDEWVSHTVRAGESLAGIAAAYGVTVTSIVPGLGGGRANSTWPVSSVKPETWTSSSFHRQTQAPATGPPLVTSSTWKDSEVVPIGTVSEC